MILTDRDRHSVRHELVQKRLDLLLVFRAALTAYLFQSAAWPLSPGRDCATYLQHYWEMWRADPLYPLLMLYRTPIASLHGVLRSHWHKAYGVFAAVALSLIPSYSVLSSIRCLATGRSPSSSSCG
jgi:hypothetical protein